MRKIIDHFICTHLERENSRIQLNYTFNLLKCDEPTRLNIVLDSLMELAINSLLVHDGVRQAGLFDALTLGDFIYDFNGSDSSEVNQMRFISLLCEELLGKLNLCAVVKPKMVGTYNVLGFFIIRRENVKLKAFINENIMSHS